MAPAGSAGIRRWYRTSWGTPIPNAHNVTRGDTIPACRSDRAARVLIRSALHTTGGTMRTVLYSIAVGAIIGAMLTEIYLAAVR